MLKVLMASAINFWHMAPEMKIVEFANSIDPDEADLFFFLFCFLQQATGLICGKQKIIATSDVYF